MCKSWLIIDLLRVEVTNLVKIIAHKYREGGYRRWGMLSQHIVQMNNLNL